MSSTARLVQTAPRPLVVAAVSAAVGLLTGIGATAAATAGSDADPAASAPTEQAVVLDDLLRDESIRIAVQRCVLAPGTPDAAEGCLAGLRAA